LPQNVIYIGTLSPRAICTTFSTASAALIVVDDQRSP
jgi:hypothetical protein